MINTVVEVWIENIDQKRCEEKLGGNYISEDRGCKAHIILPDEEGSENGKVKIDIKNPEIERDLKKIAKILDDGEQK